ncbi:MAG: hypothetical protein PUK40_04500 [Actinomycetaceae bacterium]|nr:hypothetical protein [Arcanobacterium sp.]MDD7505193.1 hypothetical protein [Actinomycetaceae bacterium]MDY6144072.1 hypothetical protein [Arcanobacterium sp.]
MDANENKENFGLDFELPDVPDGVLLVPNLKMAQERLDAEQAEIEAERAAKKHQ